MFVTVYQGSKLQLAYEVESICEEQRKRLDFIRQDICDELDPEETQFDLYLQSLLMTFDPAICVTVNTVCARREGYIWFEWGCLSLQADGHARLHIDASAEDVTVTAC